MSSTGPPDYAALLPSHDSHEHAQVDRQSDAQLLSGQVAGDSSDRGPFPDHCPRLEPFSVISLFGGTAMSLAFLGFLVFLWTHQTAAQDGQDANHIWRIIITRDWLIQAITVCTVLIRLSISTQAVICTSFVASLLFERQYFHVSDAIALSVFRGVNGGPFSFFSRFWACRKRRGLWRLEVLALLLLTAGSIALQFSSTLLVSDIGTRLIVGFPETEYYNTTFNYVEGDYNSIESLGGTPKDFTLFAQSSDGKWPFEPNYHGVSNSGIQKYAMFPVSGNRSSLRSYRGNAFVLTSQTVCMQPVMDGDIDFHQVTEFKNIPIKTRIDMKQTFKRAGLVLSPESHPPPRPMPIDCFLNGGFSYLCSRPTYSGTPHWDWEDEDVWTPGAETFLIARPTSFENVGDSTLYPAGRNLSSGDREWAYFDFPDKLGEGFFLSFCYRNFNITVDKTHISSKRHLHDRRVEHTKPSDEVPRIPDFQQNKLLAFLGADPEIQDADRREIFDLKSITPLKNRTAAIASGRSMMKLQREQTFMSTNRSSTISLNCVNCENNLPWSPDYGLLFDLIIRLTNRPAAILQILLLLSVQSIHDQVLSDFEGPATEAQTVRTVFRSAPYRYTGLISVVAIYIVTILSVGVITFLYMRRSRHSIIDNLWHTVSQVVGETTAEPLRHGNCLRDRTVAQELSEDPLVRLERCEDTGYVRLVRVGGGEKID